LITFTDSKSKEILQLKFSEFKEKYKEEINREYLFYESSFLHKLLFYNENQTYPNGKGFPKGTKPQSNFERKYLNLFYLHKGVLYQIENIKERDNYVTYIVILYSRKKHTIHMSKEDFLNRDYFKKL